MSSAIEETYPTLDVTIPYIYLTVSFIFCFILVKYISPAVSPKFYPIYRNLDRTKQLEWDTRIASNVHAILVCSILAYIFTCEEEIHTNTAWGQSPLARINCGIVVGYLLSDCVIILLHYKYIGDMAYLFHHAATIVPYYFIMNYGVMTYFGMYRLWAELSTPFVNMRWILETLSFAKDNKVYIANGLVMALTFFSSRILPIPFYYYRILSLRYREDYYTHLHYYMVIAVSTCAFLDILNVAWMAKILRGVRKVLKYKRDKNENKLKD